MNDYYKNNGVEAIEIIDKVLSYLNTTYNYSPTQLFEFGNAMKYIIRAGHKTTNADYDCFKAANYINHAIYDVWIDD